MVHDTSLRALLALSLALFGLGCGAPDDGADEDEGTMEAAFAGTLTWVSPKNGATLAETTTLSVTGAPAGTQRIAFWIDGTWLGADKTGPTYTITLDTSAFEPGTHKLSARARSANDVTLDKSDITVTLGAKGVPFGPSHGFSGTDAQTVHFSMTSEGVTASSIAGVIADAKAKEVKLIFNMTGGAHENYMTNGVFDMGKWKAKMNTYNTAAMKALVASAVADGTIVGNSVMDEPNVYGLGDGNTWGPKGTMTKAKVDSMCAYAKAIFPTLPVGVAHGHAAFEPDKSYDVCEFIIDQYSTRFGSVSAYREAALALGERDGHAILFSMNILNGGTQAAKDGLWNCPSATTGGRGTYEPNCRMSPQNVHDYGIALGPHGCGMMMWRFDDAFMNKAANQAAFAEVADVLAEAPAKTCTRD